MKRKDFIKLLEKNGWTLKRNGANHDIYHNGSAKQSQYHDTEKLMKI